jgi:hypothetical protein
MGNKIINLLVFEDTLGKGLKPFSENRPYFDFQLGSQTLLQKMIVHFQGMNLNLHVRPHLKNITKQNHPGLMVNVLNASLDSLFLNGRILIDENLVSEIKKLERKTMLLSDQGEIIAAWLGHHEITLIQNLLQEAIDSEKMIHLLKNEIPMRKTKAHLISHLLQFQDLFNVQLAKDMDQKAEGGYLRAEISPKAELISEHRITAHEQTQISAFAFLDASRGPIYIENNVHIRPYSQIIGPVYLGAGSVVEGGIIENSCIGRNSKIKGRIANSILYGHHFIDWQTEIEDCYLGLYTEISDSLKKKKLVTPDYEPFLKGQTPNPLTPVEEELILRKP